MGGLVPLIYNIFRDRANQRLARERARQEEMDFPRADDEWRLANTRLENETVDEFKARRPTHIKKYIQLRGGPNADKKLAERLDFLQNLLVGDGLPSQRAQTQPSAVGVGADTGPEMAEPAIDAGVPPTQAPAPAPARTAPSPYVPEMPSVVARRDAEQKATAAGLKAGAETAATEPILQPNRMEVQRLIQSGMDGRALLTAMQKGRPTLEQQAMEAAVAKLPPDKQKDPAAVYDVLVQLKRDFEKPTPPKLPVAGRDIPFPADVEAQRIRIAKALADARRRVESDTNTAGDLADFAEALSRGEIEVTAVPSKIRGAVIRSVHESGNLIVSVKEREAMQALDVPLSIIDDIEKYSKLVNTKEGFASRSSGAWRSAKAKLGMDPDVTLLESKAATLASVIRALGEKGNLSEGDMKRAIDSIPSAWSSTTEATKLLGDIRDILKNAKSVKMRGTSETFNAPGPPPGASSRKMTATNPKTGEKLESTDGGKTWHPPSQ